MLPAAPMFGDASSGHAKRRPKPGQTTRLRLSSTNDARRHHELPGKWGGIEPFDRGLVLTVEAEILDERGTKLPDIGLTKLTPRPTDVCLW